MTNLASGSSVFIGNGHCASSEGIHASHPPNDDTWKAQLEDVLLNEEDPKQEDKTKKSGGKFQAEFLSKMATIRGYLQSRKQYLPTVLLLICVTIYLPYSYLSVLHARQEHLNEIYTSSGFQKVINRSHMLFSAYLDDRFPREPAKLRILGFKSKKDNRELYCKLYFEDSTAMCLSNPAIELRLDPKEKRSLDTQCFFHCTLPDHLERNPIGVTLTSSKSCETNDHVVPVKFLQGDPKMKKEIAVCFSSPSGAFEGELERRHLLETLELSRYFGASSVQMYNESMDPILEQILRPYITSGFLTLLPWNPGDRYLPKVARTLSINDCIYRNMVKYRNIVFVDRDEIILPSQGYNSSWNVLGSKMRQMHPSAGAFWFAEVLYVSYMALPKGTQLKPLQPHCPLNGVSSKELPRIFTHRFVAKEKTNTKPRYVQLMLDPSVVLYVDGDMRVSFLPGKTSTYLDMEVGQSVRFTDYKNVVNFNKFDVMETFRSVYNVKLTAAIYNKLGYNQHLDLTGCVQG